MSKSLDSNTNHITILHGPHVDRAVLQLPRQLVRRTLLRIINKDEHCIRASQRCIVKFNDEIWNVQDARPRQVRHGDHFCIQIPPIDDCPHNDILRAWTGTDGQAPGSPSYSPSIGPDGSQDSFDLNRLLESDDSSLYQLTAKHWPVTLGPKQRPSDDDERPFSDDPSGSSSQSNAAAHHGDEPGRSPDLGSLPSWVQSLLPALQPSGYSHLDQEGHEAYIQTWYLNHNNHLRCDPGRPLRLDLHPDTWQDEVRNLWADLLEDNIPCWFELVYPKPLPVGDRLYIAHLMISQNRDDTVLLADRQIETVVTTIFEHDRHPRLWQLALVMPSWSLADDFFHVLMIHQLCLRRRAEGRQCTIIHGPNVLELGLRDLFHHSDSLTIHVPEAAASQSELRGPRRHRHASVDASHSSLHDGDDDPIPPRADSEIHTLLQTHSRTRTTAPSVDIIPDAPPDGSIDQNDGRIVSLETQLAHDTTIQINFESVFAIFEIISKVNPPVQIHWPKLQWETDFQSVIEAVPKWQGEDVSHFAFYTDGSRHHEHGVSASIVCLAVIVHEEEHLLDFKPTDAMALKHIKANLRLWPQLFCGLYKSPSRLSKMPLAPT